MHGIQLNIKTKHLSVMLLVFVCLSFLLFSGNSTIQYLQKDITESGNHLPVQNMLLPPVHEIPAMDIVKDSVFHYIIEGLINIQLSNCRNSGRMTMLFGLSYSFLFLSLYIISAFGKTVLQKFNRHLIIPHSSHAPPYIYA